MTVDSEQTGRQWFWQVVKMTARLGLAMAGIGKQRPEVLAARLAAVCLALVEVSRR
jgi:hypothetical protein